jgi:hypothetical protein
MVIDVYTVVVEQKSGRDVLWLTHTSFCKNDGLL